MDEETKSAIDNLHYRLNDIKGDMKSLALSFNNRVDEVKILMKEYSLSAQASTQSNLNRLGILETTIYGVSGSEEGGLSASVKRLWEATARLQRFSWLIIGGGMTLGGGIGVGISQLASIF